MIRSDRSKAEAVQVCKPEFLKWLALRRPEPLTATPWCASFLLIWLLYLYIYTYILTLNASCTDTRHIYIMNMFKTPPGESCGDSMRLSHSTAESWMELKQDKGSLGWGRKRRDKKKVPSEAMRVVVSASHKAAACCWSMRLHQNAPGTRN